MRFAMVPWLALSLASPAFGGVLPTLTGIWTGSVSCKIETAEGKGSFKEPGITLLISQTGPTGPLIANIDDGSFSFFSGTLTPSAASANEGTGALIACGTSDATTAGLPNMIQTFHYKVDTDGKGSLKISGAYVQNGSEVGVCKGSFTRTSIMSPKVVSCEAL
jgi:hypothetical protein